MKKTQKSGRRRCHKKVRFALGDELVTVFKLGPDSNYSGESSKTSKEDSLDQKDDLNDCKKRRSYNHSPRSNTKYYSETNQKSTRGSCSEIKDPSGPSTSCPYANRDILMEQSNFFIKENVSNEGIDQGSQSQSVICNENDEISEESKLVLQYPNLREEGERQLSNSSDVESEEEEGMPSIEEIDAMLEEGLSDKIKDSGKEDTLMLNSQSNLDEIGNTQFDTLPDGWVKIMHSSGMPVYFHRESRVCSMAKPYFLGSDSSTYHKVPLSAIPCLQYKRAKEIEKKNNEEREQNLTGIVAAKIETSEENEDAQSLEATDLTDYCKRLFRFKTIRSTPFKSWRDKREYIRKKHQRPTLPCGIKLLRIPNQNSDGRNSKSKCDWIINPNGQSYAWILNEYVQHAFNKNLNFQLKELENPATPYSVTVFIGDMEYGVGLGASKKQAKMEAAKAALEKLIPEIEHDGFSGMPSDDIISMFDKVKIKDPRITELSVKTTEPLPYTLLLNCLSRNLITDDIKVDYATISKLKKECEYTMEIGEYKVTVVCKNKREGKQRAAQAMLQEMHPGITYWGTLLRMFGNKSIKTIKEKKQEVQEIAKLEIKVSQNEPNYEAILEKLRSEMYKMKGKREAKAKEKVIPPENVILPSHSSTDLNNVN